MDERPHDAGEEPPLRRSADDRDVSVRAVAVFVAVFSALLGVAAVVTVVLGLRFRAELLRRDPPPSPMPEANAPVEPPAPRLQKSPEREMDDMRAHENAILSSYGWVDQGAGIGRIPIERAIDLASSRPELITTKPGADADAGAEGGTP